MGGMAAQIPIRNDPEANEAAMERVRQDKLREVKAGHDGTWVAHPGLVPVAREIFDEYMKTPNQIRQPKEARSRYHCSKSVGSTAWRDHGSQACDAISTSALQYLESWLGG